MLVYAAIDDAARRRALEARGVEVALLPSPAGKVDLAAMLADLGRREINELHVEAGEKLNASLLAAGLVDELLVYVAPRLLGSGRGLAALGAARAPRSRALGFSFVDVARVGDDLRLDRPAPRAAPPLTPARRRGASRGDDNRRMFTGIVSGVGRDRRSRSRSARGASSARR